MTEKRVLLKSICLFKIQYLNTVLILLQFYVFKYLFNYFFSVPLTELNRDVLACLVCLAVYYWLLLLLLLFLSYCTAQQSSDNLEIDSLPTLDLRGSCRSIWALIRESC